MRKQRFSTALGLGLILSGCPSVKNVSVGPSSAGSPPGLSGPPGPTTSPTPAPTASPTPVASASPSPAPLINIDFGTSSSTKTGLAGYSGLSSSDYWNSYGSVSNSGIANLFDANHLPSGVHMSTSGFDANGTNNSFPDAMMKSFHGVTTVSGGGGEAGSETKTPSSVSITFSNLSPGTYDAYVYGCEGENETEQFWISTAGVGVSNSPQATSCSDFSNTFSQGNQYVVFAGIIMTSSANSFTIEGLASAAPDTVVNGVQLVKEP